MLLRAFVWVHSFKERSKKLVGGFNEVQMVFACWHSLRA